MITNEQSMRTSTKLKLSGTALLASIVLVAGVTTASARVSMVNCEDYIVSIADEDGLNIQERIGTGIAYTDAVCTGAAQLPIDEYDTATRVNVRIEPMGYHMTVVIFPDDGLGND
jgi:hypothetical protein